VNAGLDEYKNRAPASADKLVRKYQAATGKLDAARSPDAQASYEEAMRDPAVLKRRQTNLGKLSEADLNNAMQAKGGSAYAAGTAAGADKWAKNVAPYFGEIDRIKAKLPRRTRDPAANVQSRVTPFAKGLSDMKKKQG